MTAPALICGAGPGGLLLAIRLRLAGWPVRVFEMASRELACSDAGGAYELTAPTLELLEYAGVAPRVRALGTSLRRFRMHDWRGNILQRLDFERAGFEVFSITRSALQRALRERLSALDVEVLHGTEIVSCDLEERGARVRALSGEEHAGSWAIAANGMHSALRRQHFREEGAIDLGIAAWWGRHRGALSSIEPGVSVGYVAPGCALVVANTGGELLWTLTAAGDDPEARLTLFSVELRELIAASTISRTRLFEQPPLDSFRKGRLVLIGDAAHGMSPFLGLGANSALEDAALLADALHDDSAVSRFATKRPPAINASIAEARRIGRMMHWQNAAAHALFRGVLRLVPSFWVLRSLRGKHAPGEGRRRLGATGS